MSAPRNLHHGDRGDDVVELQRRLNQILLGKVPHIPETGYFGDITRHAVQVAQRLFRIEPAAGYVGPKTRAALNVQVVVISVAPAPPPITPAPPAPPQTRPPTPPPPTPPNRTIIVPPSTWSWFNVGISLQGQLQNPGVVSGVIQVMPTLRLRPLPGSYFQARETHIELGLGLQYGLSSMTTATDPRHTVSIVGQGALVDPFVWNRWHVQFFAQAGLAINGIPATSGYNWYVTHYVLQAQGGGQLSYDLIPNRWNLFAQIYGGAQYDVTSGEGAGIVGGALGTTVTIP